MINQLSEHTAFNPENSNAKSIPLLFQKAHSTTPLTLPQQLLLYLPAHPTPAAPGATVPELSTLSWGNPAGHIPHSHPVDLLVHPSLSYTAFLTAPETT